jgi:hypothetical protein
LSKNGRFIADSENKRFDFTGPLRFFAGNTMLRQKPTLIPLQALPLMNSAPYPGFLNNGLKTTLQVVSILIGYVLNLPSNFFTSSRRWKQREQASATFLEEHFSRTSSRLFS